jgi:predicted helicase
VYKDNAGQDEYLKGFKVNELFLVNTSGIKTHNDNDLVGFKKFNNSNQLYNYRPFDIRNIEYDLKKVQRHRFSIMKHMLKENLAIMTTRQLSTFDFQHILISKQLVDMCTVSLQTKETTYAFPLYLYPEKSSQLSTVELSERIPNLNLEIVNAIAKKLNAIFTNEKEATEKTFAPIDILDYIYAVLHSPTYREKYKEFLKIDFPRVPYPKDKETFWQLVKLGGEIRQIHLLESPKVEQYITQYPIDGDNEVSKPRFISTTLNERGKVYINDTQYFDNVPEIAWNFYIGGYQPAQKWLKDRKNRTLEFEDILHYQKIIVALTETDRLMKEIDTIEIE